MKGGGSERVRKKKVTVSGRGRKKPTTAKKGESAKGDSNRSVRGAKNKTVGDSVRKKKGKKTATAAVAAAAAAAKKEAEGEVLKPSKEGSADVVVADEDKEDEPPRVLPGFMGEVNDGQKKAYAKFAKEVFALGVDGLKNEFMDNIKPYQPNPMPRTIFDQNAKLNRYKDIVCNDLTRVLIEDGKGTDYVHANWVRGDPLFNEFICTQGPIPSTNVDFWRMVMHTKCYHVIMLCDVIENGKMKCEQYWPLQKGEKQTYGDITVEHVSQNSKDAHVIKTLLRLTSGDVVQTVRHHQWKTWPDRSVPRSTKAVLRLLRTVRSSPRPVIVHCSAGVGRTGTLVAVEMCLQKILGTQTLNLMEIAKKLRDQRPSSIQMDMQYVYLAVAVLEYGTAMDYLSDYPDIVEEFAKFKGQLEFLNQPQPSANKKSDDGGGAKQ